MDSEKTFITYEHRPRDRAELAIGIYFNAGDLSTWNAMFPQKGFADRTIDVRLKWGNSYYDITKEQLLSFILSQGTHEYHDGFLPQCDGDDIE